MGRVADDASGNHRADIDQEEVGRSDPPLEQPAPEHEAQHVGREVDEAGVEKAQAISRQYSCRSMASEYMAP